MSTWNLSGRNRIIGLAMALFLAVGSSRVEAGLGIIVTDTILMPVGDPLTQYDFHLSLVAGNQILQGDNITLLNVPDYNGISSYVYTSGGIDYSKLFSIQPTAGSSAGLTNLELVLTALPGTLTNNGAQNLFIGDLIVETTVPFPPPSSSPLFAPLNYTTQTHLVASGALNLGFGITPAPSVVPEPSSSILLAVGFALSATLVARGRRPTCPA